jgi:glyoxylase-like metal-dependent hydrolase (beta-lactamase superfamily II)
LGDTLFMPDYGTARCDFPAVAAAATLNRSIQRLLTLSDETRVFLCHDYKAPERKTFAWESTIGGQRRENVHIHSGVSEADFIALREARERTLDTSASWLNAVEGFFAILTKRRLKRGVFKGVVDLQAAINRFVADHNQQPKPFVWTPDPDKIIAATRGHQVLDSIR